VKSRAISHALTVLFIATSALADQHAGDQLSNVILETGTSRSVYPDSMPYATVQRTYFSHALAYWSDMIVAADPAFSEITFHPDLRYWITSRIAIRGFEYTQITPEYTETIDRLVAISRTALAEQNSDENTSLDAVYKAFAECLASHICDDETKAAVLRIIENGQLFRLICARVVVRIADHHSDAYFPRRIENIAFRYYNFDLSGDRRIQLLRTAGLVRTFGGGQGDGFFLSTQGNQLRRPEANGDKRIETGFSIRLWDESGFWGMGEAASICEVVYRRVDVPVDGAIYYVSGVSWRYFDLEEDDDEAFSLESIILRPLPVVCDPG